MFSEGVICFKRIFIFDLVFCTNCGDHSQCSVLALDESALDVDQVDNLIMFCPTKEEMELLKVLLSFCATAYIQWPESYCISFSLH